MTLAFIILRMLTKEELTGYNLAKKIEQDTGWKPSYGSLYPTLNSLKKGNLAKLKISGRRKIYSITSEGRKKLVDFEENKESLMKNMENHLMVMNKCLGDNPSFMKNMFKMIKKGRMPFGAITSEALQLRNIMMKLSMDGRTEKNAGKIKSILRKTIKELESL